MGIRILDGRPLLRLAAITAAAFMATYVVTEHLGHIWRFLPYLVLLACPLMHLFHGNHQHRSSARGHKAGPDHRTG